MSSSVDTITINIRHTKAQSHIINSSLHPHVLLLFTSVYKQQQNRFISTYNITTLTLTRYLLELTHQTNWTSENQLTLTNNNGVKNQHPTTHHSTCEPELTRRWTLCLNIPSQCLPNWTGHHLSKEPVLLSRACCFYLWGSFWQDAPFVCVAFVAFTITETCTHL